MDFSAWMPVIAAVATGLLSLAGVYFSNRTSYKLFEYRLKKLEEKVDKHNDLVERMTAVEVKIKDIEGSIGDLKKKVG